MLGLRVRGMRGPWLEACQIGRKDPPFGLFQVMHLLSCQIGQKSAGKLGKEGLIQEAMIVPNTIA
jgi:hypothetical protein